MHQWVLTVIHFIQCDAAALNTSYSYIAKLTYQFHRKKSRNKKIKSYINLECVAWAECLAELLPFVYSVKDVNFER